jgi:dethiobiotin synthetase
VTAPTTVPTTPAGPTGILIITGTSTGVGKTVVTAAIASLAIAAGKSVAVVKPAQTGVDPAAPEDCDVPDADTVTRLCGVTDTHELARFPDPLSPEAAARRSGRPPLDVEAAADYIVKLSAERDLVLVEGAGGLLVRYDPAGRTLADLALALATRCRPALQAQSPSEDLSATAGRSVGHAPAVAVLIVAAAGLGTLNHTALTAEALRARDLPRAGVVIGSWPDHPGLADRENLADLPVAAGAPLAGVLPEGAGALARQEFLAMARLGLTPALGGTRDSHASLPSAGPASL